jgi:heme oxygenase
MNAAGAKRLSAKLATNYARRFKTVVKWDSRTSVWCAFVPVLDQLSVCAPSRDEVIESATRAIRSYLR